MSKPMSKPSQSWTVLASNVEYVIAVDARGKVWRICISTGVATPINFPSTDQRLV
jgi:hypothetical protein